MFRIVINIILHIYIMSISSQYGMTYIRNEANLLLVFWNNPNSPTWIKRMLPPGGNKNQGNYGINGKRFENKRLSRLIFT